MSDKEATARIKINKLLETAGWRFFQDGSAPANIRLEPSVTIKTTDLDALGDNFEKSTKGFVDFLLLDAKGFPLLVLEAKAEDKNPLIGKEQARKYAKSQNCRFVILSNGNLHYFWDLERGSPYVITSFPTPDSVTGYREGGLATSNFTLVELGDIFEITSSKRVFESEWKSIGVPFYRAREIVKLAKDGFVENELFISDEMFEDYASKYGAPQEGDMMVTGVGTLGICYVVQRGDRFYFKDGNIIWLKKKTENLTDFVRHLFQSDFVKRQIGQTAGATVGTFTIINAKKTKIPLPPLEVQKEIVAEIEGYQKVINGARAVLDHYRPHIPIHPDWPMVELREIIDELESGVSVNSTSTPTNKGELGILKTSCVTTGIFQPEEHKTVVPDELTRVRCPVRGNTIIISRMNTEALVGANAYVDKDYPHLFLPDRLWQTVITRPGVEVRYIQTVLASDSCRSRISAICGGTSGSMKNIAKPQLLSITVPLPPLATQRAIVAEIEAEQALVAANRELIIRFEQKIQATLARVWGKGTPPLEEV